MRTSLQMAEKIPAVVCLVGAAVADAMEYAAWHPSYTSVGIIYINSSTYILYGSFSFNV